MATGRLIDQNRALTAAIAGGAWSADLPLSNLLEDGRYVQAPARCLDPTDLAKSQFTVTLDRKRPVSIVALLFHTLSPAAKYRLTVAGSDGDLGSPLYASGWQRVFPRVFHSIDLDWSEPNWWRGTMADEELDLFRRHRWMPFARGTSTKIKVEIDDRGNAAGYIDIGGLLIGDGFTSGINYERGRELGLASRDLVDEAPSGRLFAEARPGRRVLSVSWASLTDSHVFRLVDAGARAGTSRTVFFLPDVDDEVSLYREAFPGTFEKAPSGRFTWRNSNTSSATFREILG